jgi:hypothetical protein
VQQLNSHEYYVTRAQASRRLAERAASPYIAAIHSDLASRYEHTADKLARTPETSDRS